MKLPLVPFLLILLQLGLASPTIAQQIPETKEARAYRVVRDAPYFAVGGIGYSGALSVGERALHVLIAANDTRYFAALLREKSEVAKLYGLTALRYYNAPQYTVFAIALGDSKATVQTMRGCIRNSEPVAQVAKRIDEDSFGTLIAENIKRSNENKN